MLNPNSEVYLRQLEKDLKVSSNTVRLELNKLAVIKLIEEVKSEKVKIKKFRANLYHPLYEKLRSLIFNYLGIDHLLDDIFLKLGNLKEVYLTGDFAEGKDSLFIDLVLVGEIDKVYYNKLVTEAEILLSKKIRTAFYMPNEFNTKLLNNVATVCIFNAENENQRNVNYD